MIPTTVVIPAYNEEHYISGVLSQLQLQSVRNFEVIVVDNNSTDATASIARSFGVKVIHEPVQGMTPARERGFAEASGELILRTDADTLLPPTWVERYQQLFIDHPEIVAASGNLTIPIPLGGLIISGYNLLCRLLLGHSQLNGPNMAIRKSVWQQVEVCRDDTQVHEDIDLSIHMAEKGTIQFVPDFFVTYSMRRFQRSFWGTLFEYLFRQYTTIAYHKK